jgi:hypothetical protein
MAYQDGMIDGLERAFNYQGSGEYSNPNYLNDMSNIYDNILSEKLEKNLYLDAAYIDGYNLSLMFLLLNKEDRPGKYPPIYFLFGYSIDCIKELQDIKQKFKEKFTKEYNYVNDIVKKMKQGETYHHKPFFTD